MLKEDVKEESFTYMGIFSQGTLNEIAKTLGVNTPPDPPVIRDRSDKISENDISLDFSKSYTMKNIADKYKVADYNNSKLMYLPKDSRFRISLAYNKLCNNDLYVRIYPSSTDHAFKHRPIVCCSNHLQTITKATIDQLECATKSILEIHDTDAKYEAIELPRNEEQISVLVKYTRPDVILDLVIKCYNTCQQGFKKNYPKLNFAIEQCVEPNRKYVVLSEKSIYFKVCASPARDCKSMSLRKRPFKQEKVDQPQPNDTNDFVEIKGKRFFPILVDEDMLGIVKSIIKYKNNEDPEIKEKIEILQNHFTQSIRNFVFDPHEDIENQYLQPNSLKIDHTFSLK